MNTENRSAVFMAASVVLNALVLRMLTYNERLCHGHIPRSKTIGVVRLIRAGGLGACGYKLEYGENMEKAIELEAVMCPESRCPLNCDGSCQDIGTILLDVPDPDEGCSLYELLR